jgi:myo-inositol-1(or 4)-monophosphatase
MAFQLMTNESTVLLTAMREAGQAILSLSRDEVDIRLKANADIVTRADLLANEILQTHLRTAFPGDGWLSEETTDNAERLTCQRVWVVDPIDGTREFAAGIPEYAMSVALIENGEPIVAAIYNPATDELFHAIKGNGAWQGDHQLKCRHGTANQLLLLASRSEYKRGEWERFKQHHQVTQVGSIAYKLALVAAGKADATFSLGPKSEWDVAAGALLVTEAGGIVTNNYQRKLIFNQERVLIDGIVATSADVNDKVFQLIK